MRYIKKFVRFIKESTADIEMPTFATEIEASAGPTTKPPTEKPKVPVKPKEPKKPKWKEDEEKINVPSRDPQRKAVTAMDVVYRFIEEMHKKGESIKKIYVIK